MVSSALVVWSASVPCVLPDASVLPTHWARQSGSCRGCDLRVDLAVRLRDMIERLRGVVEKVLQR
jgi:hypothetical protein